ncbi:MAG: hypothetical protein EAX86_09245 [Candidatus Heimdallarchaeota archaeon]|nr:hypothetical protein [Candidatus Heimdallarchaeota archaeon]
MRMVFDIFSTFCVYLLPVFVALINLKFNNDNLRYGILSYCALVTAFAWQVGADFNRYLGIINNATEFEFTLIEPLTEFIYFLTNQIGEPRFFWGILALITYGSLFLFIQDLEESEKDGTVVLFFLLFGIFGIALRQISSVAVSLLAIQSFYNKQYKKAGIFLLLAWSIHKTVVMVPLIPIVGLVLSKLNRYYLALVLPSVLFLITIYQDIILSFLIPIPLLGKYWLALMTYEEGIYLSPLRIAISIGFGFVYLFSCTWMRRNLSPKNYIFYLTGIFGLGLLFGFSSVHAGRLMVAFGAIGIPSFTHFFKMKDVSNNQELPNLLRSFKTCKYSGILAITFSVIFIIVLLFEYDYFPYNISKDIPWESEDDLEYKLGYYNSGEVESPYHMNKVVEFYLIPGILILFFCTAASYVFFQLWNVLKMQYQSTQ